MEQKKKSIECQNSKNPSSSGSDGNCLADNSELFYHELSQFYDSCGLNLVCNVRHTVLDLHIFYKEVTARGGFCKVTKGRRWEEVAYALKLEGINMNCRHQLQRVYALFLYQFEKIYGAQFSGGTKEQKPSPHMKSRKKDQPKKHSLPLKVKSAYQIFIKKECDRLRKNCVERQKGQSYLSIAIDAWKCLPESDRQQYIEESKREKLRIFKEACKVQGTKNTELEEVAILVDDDYHVLCQPEENDASQVPDQSAIDYAIAMMKKSSDTDCLLHLELGQHVNAAE